MIRFLFGHELRHQLDAFARISREERRRVRAEEHSGCVEPVLMQVKWDKNEVTDVNS